MVLFKDEAISRHKLPTDMNRPIHLADSTLDHRAHVCAFFSSPDEKYRILLPFIKEGFECGQKSVHTIDPCLRTEHCHRLASGGVDLDGVLENSHLELLDWSNTHLPDGNFDECKTLSMYRQIMDDATRRGFPLTRFVTDMGWALEADIDANTLLEYESNANNEWIQQCGPVNPVVCTYDLSRFSADIIVDVMRTHPMVIIGGMLHENPFFVPPEEFLEELRHRKPTRLKRVG